MLASSPPRGPTYTRGLESVVIEDGALMGRARSEASMRWSALPGWSAFGWALLASAATVGAQTPNRAG